MKKILYITWIIWLIAVCWSICYFIITEANISKQKFNIENEKIIEQKSEKCREEFRKYYDNNNYDRSDFHEDFNNGNLVRFDNYRVDDIRYSNETQSCIQFWYWAYTFYEGNTMYEYKITDETNRTNIYYCSHSKTHSTNNKTKEECEDDYNKELKKLWIK